MVAFKYGGKNQLIGLPVAWEDLRFPASNLRVNPANSKPDANADTGVYLFDPSTPERVTAQVQFPHSWKEGSTITPHVHWMKTTSASGDVVWRLEYKKIPINGVLDADWTQIDSVNTVRGTEDTNTANKHLITSFGEIDMTGGKISDMMFVRIWRQANASGDTYNADVGLLEFDIHYQVNTNGSRQEFIK